MNLHDFFTLLILLIIVNPGRLNSSPDHLSRIETSEEQPNIEEGLSHA